MKFELHVVPVVVFLFVCPLGPLQAQPADISIQQRLDSHVTLIKGSEDPSSIPLGLRMKGFFDSHGGKGGATEQEVVSLIVDRVSISQRDAVALAKRALGEAVAAKELGEESSARQRTTIEDLCRRAFPLNTAEIGTVEFGAALYEMDRSDEQRLTEHYESVLATLSEQSRAALLEYVDREVAPRMIYGRINYAGLFAEFPQLAEQRLQESCSDKAAVDDDGNRPRSDGESDSVNAPGEGE